MPFLHSWITVALAALVYAYMRHWGWLPLTCTGIVTLLLSGWWVPVIRRSPHWQLALSVASIFLSLAGSVATRPDLAADSINLIVTLLLWLAAFGDDWPRWRRRLGVWRRATTRLARPVMPLPSARSCPRPEWWGCLRGGPATSWSCPTWRFRRFLGCPVRLAGSTGRRRRCRNRLRP